MNPEDYQQLKNQQHEADLKMANARRAWAEMSYPTSLAMGGEIAAYKEESKALNREYARLNAANENKP